jgi:hypothetical protein
MSLPLPGKLNGLLICCVDDWAVFRCSLPAPLSFGKCNHADGCRHPVFFCDIKWRKTVFLYILPQISSIIEP